MTYEVTNYVQAVVRRIECCKETGNPDEADTVWVEFCELAEPWEVDQAKELLGRD